MYTVVDSFGVQGKDADNKLKRSLYHIFDTLKNSSNSTPYSLSRLLYALKEISKILSDAVYNVSYCVPDILCGVCDKAPYSVHYVGYNIAYSAEHRRNSLTQRCKCRHHSILNRAEFLGDCALNSCKFLSYVVLNRNNPVTDIPQLVCDRFLDAIKFFCNRVLNCCEFIGYAVLNTDYPFAYTLQLTEYRVLDAVEFICNRSLYIIECGYNLINYRL